MYIIKNNTEIEITEKRSKFITRIFNISGEDEINILIRDIKKKEKGACHNCYAYRILTDRKAVIERKNDDGEPGGTAGAPMLAVLTGEDLINTLVVTTRYFGGIKLGTGGLVSVYKKGVKEEVKVSGKKEFSIMIKRQIIFPINNIRHADYLFKNSGISIIGKKFVGQKVVYLIEAPEQNEKKIAEIADAIQAELSNKGDL
jgi:uncharacterized YigZ family protein